MSIIAVKRLLSEYKLAEADKLLEKAPDINPIDKLFLKAEILTKQIKIDKLRQIVLELHEKQDNFTPQHVFQNYMLLIRLAHNDEDKFEFYEYLSYAVYMYRQLDLVIRDEIEEYYAELLTYEGIQALEENHLRLAEEYFSMSMSINARIRNDYANTTNFRYLGIINRLQNRVVDAANLFSKGLLLHNMVNNPLSMAKTLVELIVTAIQLEKTNDAKEVLGILEFIRNESDIPEISNLYSYSKGLLLKTSPRMQNRKQAIDIFEDLLTRDFQSYHEQCYINLIETQLTFCEDTSSGVSIDAVNSQINKFYKFAQKVKSIPGILQTFLLHSQLYLLNQQYDIASNYLTQAVLLAKEYELEAYLDQIDTINQSIHLEIYLQDLDNTPENIDVSNTVNP